MIQLSTIPVENKNSPDSTNHRAGNQRIEKLIGADRHTSGQNWKTILKHCKISTQELLEFLELDSHPLATKEAEALFALKVPPNYLSKIKKRDPKDPLLLQILPQKAEFKAVDGYLESPLEEEHYTPVKGLIHKYKNRALLITTSSCAINCRYCFRRSFPYNEHRIAKSQWDDALEYIKKNKDIDEVILSGGDPLLLNDDYLFSLISKIEQINHVKRLRIHSRLLTTLPERADSDFLEKISQINSQIIIVLHCNHPNELGKEHHQLFQKLKNAGVTLLNQSVLLKGVNDRAETLSKLSLKLFEYGVLPYYLFVMDKVTGAAHFDLPETTAVSIFKDLQSSLPGYLVPRLAREIPDKPSKTLITTS